jgi:SAM-dependent methyltransferase
MYTGERAVPHAFLGVTIAQGTAAYQFVAQQVVGKRVLDVACGEGYGTLVLAEHAQEVVGIDRDPVVVQRAAERYQRPNLSFQCVDADSLLQMFGPRSFDAVCAFQFIEHRKDQEGFLRLLARVSRPGGLVVASTPNRRVFPSYNPYHVREFDCVEFQTLCASVFPDVKIVGVFGDRSVLEYRQRKQVTGDWLLRLDVLRAREWMPRWLMQRVYDAASWTLLKRGTYLRHRALVDSITPKNFSVSAEHLADALDFVVLAPVPLMNPIAVSVGVPQDATRVARW